MRKPKSFGFRYVYIRRHSCFCVQAHPDGAGSMSAYDEGPAFAKLWVLSGFRIRDQTGWLLLDCVKDVELHCCNAFTTSYIATTSNTREKQGFLPSITRRTGLFCLFFLRHRVTWAVNFSSDPEVLAEMRLPGIVLIARYGNMKVSCLVPWALWRWGDFS